MVKRYRNEKASQADRYLDFYRGQRSLNAALEKAVLAELPNGKRFSHQRRIPRRALETMRDRLLKRTSAIKAFNHFDDLHQLIGSEAKTIYGFGELATYDTAHRLGAFLGLSPQKVYLHAGARVGAKWFGIRGSVKAVELSNLPAPIRKLSAEQVEDFLCIYKQALQDLSFASER